MAVRSEYNHDLWKASQQQLFACPAKKRLAGLDLAESSERLRPDQSTDEKVPKYLPLPASSRAPLPPSSKFRLSTRLACLLSTRPEEVAVWVRFTGKNVHVHNENKRLDCAALVRCVAACGSM
jgi:hypothetical protein